MHSVMYPYPVLLDPRNRYLGSRWTMFYEDRVNMKHHVSFAVLLSKMFTSSRCPTLP